MTTKKIFRARGDFMNEKRIAENLAAVDAHFHSEARRRAADRSVRRIVK